jgi:hypothetical protein
MRSSPVLLTVCSREDKSRTYQLAALCRGIERKSSAGIFPSHGPFHQQESLNPTKDMAIPVKESETVSLCLFWNPGKGREDSKENRGRAVDIDCPRREILPSL